MMVEEHNKSRFGVVAIAKWVEEEYRNKRTTGISDEEMLMQARKHMPKCFESDLDRIKKKAGELVTSLIKEIKDDKRVISMKPAAAEPFLEEMVRKEPSIHFIYIVDTKGKKVTENITQQEDMEQFEKKGLGSDFSTREWFMVPMKTGNIHVSNLYASKITEKLCITVSAPIKNKKNETVGILGIDMKFEDLAKL